MNKQEYRDRVALWLHDNAGNLLVQDDRGRGLGLKFPGGGIDSGQSVNDAAMREALEEVGYSLAEKPRAIPGVRARKIDWDPVFSAEAAAKGRNYRGSKHYHRIAPAGESDESLLGSEGDALKANWMPIEEVLEATRSAAANPNNKYNYFDEERLNAAEKVYEMLNQKTSSYESPYMNAYLVGKKLAEAQFDDFNNVSDPDGYDVEVLEAANEDPKDFRSTRGREPQDPATNNYLSPKEKSNFARRPEEITSEDSYATNHPKRDNLRGYNNA